MQRIIARLVSLVTAAFALLICFGSFAVPAAQAAPTKAYCSNGVIFYKDSYQSGQQFQMCLQPGQGQKWATMPAGWNDQVSSFATSTRILIYEDAGFRGKCVGIRGQEIWGNLSQIQMRNGKSWNDQISSVVVNPSNWEWINCR